MKAVPAAGQPVLPCTVVPQNTPALRCTRALRVLPGRRWVLGASVGGMAVIAKLFLDTDPAAQRHYQREIAGARALGNAGIAAPTVIASGRCQQPAGWYVLTGELPGVTLAQSGDSPQALSAWMTALAALHGARLDQTDPHLGNYLWDGVRLVVLDPGGLRHASGLRRRGRARRALADALAELPLAADVTALAGLYAAARGWQPWPDGALGAALRRARARRARKYALKSLRSCREFAVERSACRFLVLDRDADTPELRALLAKPDAAFGPGANWIKQGRSAQLVRVTLPDGDVVLKRYVARDPLRGLRRALRPSRAVRAWVSAQRLRLFGVPVARPLAVLERRLGRLRGRAYLVSRFVPGVPFTQHVDAPGTHAALATLLRHFAALNLSHGDLKASNVLINPAGQALALDLDGARVHRTRFGLRRASARDHARLLANLAHDPAAQSALARALEAAA